MQWTREGAHNILQVRALMASHEWEEKWLEYVMPNLDKNKIYEQQPSRNPGTIRIGRDPAQCDIVLSHPTVSGLHVEILFHPQQHCFYLRNLRMGNSPIVDGQRLQQEGVKLRPNSIIYLGQMQL